MLQKQIYVQFIHRDQQMWKVNNFIIKFKIFQLEGTEILHYKDTVVKKSKPPSPLTLQLIITE